MRGPPHLVVRRRGDRPELSSGDGSADGGGEMRSAAFLRLYGAEVLHLPPDTAPSVLPKPIYQRREVNASRAARR